MEHKRYASGSSVGSGSGYDYTASSDNMSTFTGRTSVSSGGLSSASGQGDEHMLRLAQHVGSIRTDFVERPVPGGYYMSPDLTGVATKCSIFPDGYASVMRVLGNDKTDTVHLGLPTEARAVAAMALLDRFTICSVQLNALAVVAPDAGAMGVTRGKVQMQDWLFKFIEQMSSLQAESEAIAGVIVRVCRGRFELERFDPQIMQPEVDRMVDLMLSGVRRVSVHKRDPDSFVGSARESLGKLMQRREEQGNAPVVLPGVFNEMNKAVPRSSGYTGKVPLYVQWIAGVQHNPRVARIVNKVESRSSRKGFIGDG